MAYQHSEKLAKVQKLLARTIDGVSSSSERWSGFLSTAGAKFYKYNFADQALIFAQRPMLRRALRFAVEQAGTLRKARKYRHSLA